MLRWYRFTWGFFFSERLSMLNILSTQTHTTEAGLTMTSREIAELTGKNHADVLRDIRNMLEVLKKDASIFAGIYKDAYGSPQNIQPIWFEDTFSELLGAIS